MDADKTSADLAIIKEQLNRLNHKLNTIMQAQKKDTWLKGHDVMKITVWSDKEKLRRARERGYVEQKKDKVKGIVYRLESIPEIFLKILADLGQLA